MVAKLAIYRGDALEREIELGPRTAKIGRGDQNDIVLPDPAKSVSRFHAELRFENGRYTVVDLNSQNGTWVAGKRVAQTVLEPGVPVVVGTYKLVFVGDAPEEADAEKTIISGPAPASPPAPKPQPPVTPPLAATPPGVVTPPAAAPRPSEPPRAAPAAAAAPAAPKAQAPATGTPAAKPAPPAPAPASPPPSAPAPAPPPPAAPKPAAAAAPPPPKPAPPAAPPPAPPKPAAPVAAAAAKPQAPAKPASPGGRGGLSKGLIYGAFAVLVLAAAGAGIYFWMPPRGASTPAEPAPTAASAPAQPASSAPASAGAAQQPAAAGAGAAPVAALPPAKTEPAPARPSPAGAPPVKKASRRPAEPPASPAKPRDLGALLAQARSAMIKGEYLAAISALDTVLKADPNYQDAAQMMDMAKAGARNAAQLAVDTGGKSEIAGDYEAALRQYEQALQLDPSSQAATDAMKRLRGRMQADGEDAFRRARQFDALGRTSDAIAMYEKAIKLLPPDHANAKTARERLAALRGGNL